MGLILYLAQSPLREAVVPGVEMVGHQVKMEIMVGQVAVGEPVERREMETHQPHLQMAVTAHLLLLGKETTEPQEQAFHIILVVAVAVLLLRVQPLLLATVATAAQEQHQLFPGHQLHMLVVEVVPRIQLKLLARVVQAVEEPVAVELMVILAIMELLI